MLTSTSATSLRSIQRRLVALAPGAVTSSDGAFSIDVSAQRSTEPARLADGTLIEGSAMGTHAVAAAAATSFVGFLDGTQTSRVVCHADGLPIVHGRSAAVVRERVDRRMRTWRWTVSERVYAPRAMLGPEWNARLDALGADIVDTSALADSATAAHPLGAAEVAVHAVQRDRERLEQELAESWCLSEDRPLLIDGGISGSTRVAASRCVVGVVKSHRLLYVQGEAMRAVLAMSRGERSSVFRIGEPGGRRSPVASWYLRLHDPAGHDPMWGLVRIECAVEPNADAADRAGEISSWVLAETVPLSLPDARWDRMVYGIRDCEEFLRAVAS